MPCGKTNNRRIWREREKKQAQQKEETLGWVVPKIPRCKQKKKEQTRGEMSDGGGPQGGDLISTFSLLPFHFSSILQLALPCSPGLSVCQHLWPCTFLFRNKFSLSLICKSLLFCSFCTSWCCRSLVCPVMVGLFPGLGPEALSSVLLPCNKIMTRGPFLFLFSYKASALLCTVHSYLGLFSTGG